MSADRLNALFDATLALNRALKNIYGDDVGLTIGLDDRALRHVEMHIRAGTVTFERTDTRRVEAGFELMGVKFRPISICSSPFLLEALKEAREWIKHQLILRGFADNDAEVDRDPTVARIDSAIAAATRET